MSLLGCLHAGLTLAGQTRLSVALGPFSDLTIHPFLTGSLSPSSLARMPLPMRSVYARTTQSLTPHGSWPSPGRKQTWPSGGCSTSSFALGTVTPSYQG